MGGGATLVVAVRELLFHRGGVGGLTYMLTSTDE